MQSRDEILARYRPIRASVQAVLAEAVKHCRKPDFDRAAKHLDLVAQEQLEDEETFAMLCDIALFEPNQRGRRVIDGYLDKPASFLDADDRDLATKLASARFSIFRVAGWHRDGGFWLEDLLARERLWLMDEGLEASAPEGFVIAMRLFDAGPFHAGLGIVVQPDADRVAFCTPSASRGNPLPVRHSLAAALYGDAIAAKIPIPQGDLLAQLDAMETAPAVRPPPRSRRGKSRCGPR